MLFTLTQLCYFTLSEILLVCVWCPQAEKEETTPAIEETPFQAPATVTSSTDWGAAPSVQPGTAPTDATDWATLSDPPKDVSIAQDKCCQ
jgi:hypothetical protein